MKLGDPIDFRLTLTTPFQTGRVLAFDEKTVVITWDEETVVGGIVSRLHFVPRGDIALVVPDEPPSPPPPV